MPFIPSCPSQHPTFTFSPILRYAAQGRHRRQQGGVGGALAVEQAAAHRLQRPRPHLQGRPPQVPQGGARSRERAARHNRKRRALPSGRAAAGTLTGGRRIYTRTPTTIGTACSTSRRAQRAESRRAQRAKTRAVAELRADES
eukprot:6026446-Pleurochrysis_carterae.AAC.1